MLCQELIGSEDVAGMSVREQVERLYEGERRNIYSYVLYLGLPAARAQELTQDAFLKLYVTLSEGKRSKIRGHGCTASRTIWLCARSRVVRDLTNWTRRPRSPTNGPTRRMRSSRSGVPPRC